jgi:mannose-6-phosphate isomerase-like protein (cupin superfamily)
MVILSGFKNTWNDYCIFEFSKTMIMKRLIIFLVIASFTLSSHAQLIRVNGYETILSPKKGEDIPDDLKAIQYKKYLTQDYKPAYVDDFKERAFLRYNIFEDQMEFVKDENIYYLKKDVGRTIRFADNSIYKVYDLNGEPHFFLVHTDGKNALIAKHVVRFIEGKKATSGYDRDKPADYKRRKDELYFVLDGKGLVEVPSKKKDFYAVFGSNGNTIKDYMKKNKLNYKKEEDLKKVILYLNTL